MNSKFNPSAFSDSYGAALQSIYVPLAEKIPDLLEALISTDQKLSDAISVADLDESERNEESIEAADEAAVAASKAFDVKHRQVLADALKVTGHTEELLWAFANDCADYVVSDGVYNFLETCISAEHGVFAREAFYRLGYRLLACKEPQTSHVPLAPISLLKEATMPGYVTDDAGETSLDVEYWNKKSIEDFGEGESDED